jgi:hypothetical protein
VRRLIQRPGRGAVAAGLLLVVAIAVALAAIPRDAGPRFAPAAQAVLDDGLKIGVQDDRLAVAPLTELDARMDRLAGLGVRVTRVDVLWDAVAPTRPAHPADPSDPAYRWERYDIVARGLAQRGITPIFNVYRTPGWANGWRAVQWAPNIADYTDFMQALARRYDGRDGRPRVAMFEPWNEPNLPWFLKPQWEGVPGQEHPVSPEIYSGMLRAAYGAIKSAQPDAAVIGVSGGPTGTNRPPDGAVGILDFVRDLTRYHPPLDAYAQHLYPALGPDAATAMPSFRALPALISELDQLKPDAPLLITEFGWTTTPSPYRSAYVSEADQAAYLPEALAALRANPRVRLAIWFNLQDNAGWPSGLLREDGTEKPAWAALAKGMRSGNPDIGFG